jgi:hypothetical protein
MKYVTYSQAGKNMVRTSFFYNIAPGQTTSSAVIFTLK